MPELPEVETIRSSLAPLLLGKRVEGLEVYSPGVVIEYGNVTVLTAIVFALRRRGKYLMIDLREDTSRPKHLSTIMVHFRMTGKLLYKDHFAEAAKHTHVRFYLSDTLGEMSFLDFNDVRRFGKVWLLPPGGESLDPGFSRLGPEPLSEEWTAADFIAQIKRRPRSTIKSLLLNQEVVAGIGNIYCDEALFRAGIHPARSNETLSKEEALNLQQAVREVITEGIGHQGTSFSDYVDGLGNRGHFQLQLRVFQKEGKTCDVCGSEIEKIRLGGRGTHFCPCCQPYLVDKK
ncbi:MAG: bifunctional DNA-formamidopyrimidine glycosylase/DNA-(apurinic or apyrimidinic site) lyase [Clostridiaceae bacterium]|nr:bifunctional DNA-formamidopyrimidine glycosylase/DNA-(apurinic or apyrimidinic site) lyase [Clostridiaceae bacterium]